MCNVYIPKIPNISRSDARSAMKESLKESKEFHKSVREGNWKSDYEIKIITKAK